MAEMISKDKSEHNWFIVALILSNILIYVTMVGLNALGSVPQNATSIYPMAVGEVSDKYFLDITPGGWVFSFIWTTIFVWQFIWLVYAFVCIFRHTSDGDLLYRKFDFINFGIFIAFIVNNISIIAWLFVWTNKYIGWALFLIVIASISLHVCLFISLRRSYYLKSDMETHRLKPDIWLNRIILQNGLGFFLTWLSLATNLNFATFLTYENGVDMQLSSTIALIFILAIIVVYFVVESIIWPRYLLYMFTPWFVVIIALIGSVAKNWISTKPTRNNIITLILLIITVLLAISKIVLFILYKTKFTNRIKPLPKHVPLETKSEKQTPI